MSNSTYIQLTGWVTRDPELRRTNSRKTPVCTVRLGTAHRWPDKSTGEWREGPVSYFDVVCWRSLAVNVSASLRKGQMVTIHGTFRNRVWTDRENRPRTTLEITASSVGHELTYGWSHYNRMKSSSSKSDAEPAAGDVGWGLDGAAPGQEPREEAGWLGQESGPEPGGPGEETGREFGGMREEAGLAPGELGQESDGLDEEFGQSEISPFLGGYERADADPAADPVYEPDSGRDYVPGGEPVGGQIFGTGHEDDASDGVADVPRLAEVAVPV